jgi:hypothetical protein
MRRCGRQADTSASAPTPVRGSRSARKASTAFQQQRSGGGWWPCLRWASQATTSSKSRLCQALAGPRDHLGDHPLAAAAVQPADGGQQPQPAAACVKVPAPSAGWWPNTFALDRPEFAHTITTVDVTAIVRHFELIGVDNDAAAEIYTDDAVLEYVQSNERIRGRDNIIASRRAYPGRPTRFSVYRCLMFGATAAVELVMHIEGDQPHPVVAILDLNGDAISRERIYIAEPWPAPDYREAWAESITDST